MDLKADVQSLMTDLGVDAALLDAGDLPCRSPLDGQPIEILMER